MKIKIKINSVKNKGKRERTKFYGKINCHRVRQKYLQDGKEQKRQELVKNFSKKTNGKRHDSHKGDLRH